MLFKYQALDKQGAKQDGSIEALNTDVAVGALQRRGLIVVAINAVKERSPIISRLNFFHRVSAKDIVILSRQMSTLFSAQVSALRVFSLLAAEADDDFMRNHLSEVANDLQGGSSISHALSKHPQVFTDFYVNMVKAGEEAGKLDQTFGYLADYLDRTYEVTSKAKNALVYPSFIVVTFIGVMVFMLTSIIPKISEIIKQSGQEVPIYTKAVMAISDFATAYWLPGIIVLVIGGFFFRRYGASDSGRLQVSYYKLRMPYVGSLYRKLYLSRISDNLHTMLLSAIPIVKALEVTASVVGDVSYENILKTIADDVRKGSTISESMAKHPELPGIMVQMVKVGEETGEVGSILDTLAKFYAREVTNAVDTIIGLIEPVMIILLAVGVGILLAAVLMPIYNLAGAIN
jgi:type IV pilus assembly protein PilC